MRCSSCIYRRTSTSSPSHFSCLLHLSVYMHVAAALLNVTIDDETGDEVTGVNPTYTPSGSSGNWVQGATCSGCLAKPDPSDAHGGTWHDATHGPGDPFQRAIEISFTGTAVYTFFICANTVEFATTLTNLTFALDGAQAGSFVHEPKATTDYEYNVLGYANSSIPDGQHQLLIQTTGDVNASLILFDYMIYSTNQVITTSSSTPTSLKSTPTSSTTTASASPSSSAATQSKETDGTVNTGRIVGAVAGAIAAAVTVGLVFICWRRRRGGGQPIPGRRRRAIENPDESGSDYNAASAVPLSTSQNNNSHLIYPRPAMVESQYLMPSSERTNTSYPSISSLNSTPLAVPNTDVPLSGGRSNNNSASVNRGAIRKARERQTEIVRQVAEMQQRVAVLRSRSTTNGSVSGEGEMPTDSVAGTPDGEADLRNQIRALQAEVERLQSQREYFQQLGWGDEPPPEYVEDDGMDNARHI